MLDAGDWAIPAGPSTFLATIRPLSHERHVIVLAMAETWVAADMLFPEQEKQIAALRFGHTGCTLGDRLFVPSLLREIPHVGAASGGRTRIDI